MSRRLAQAVHVTGVNGDVTVYRPGDTPTAEHAKLIRNPLAWEPAEEKPAKGKARRDDGE